MWNESKATGEFLIIDDALWTLVWISEVCVCTMNIDDLKVIKGEVSSNSSS